MMRIPCPVALSLFALSIVSSAAHALSVEEVVSATYDGGELPDDQSALMAKVQVLLDRAGISPAVVDGHKGGMSESALRAFETQRGFEVDGLMDEQVWMALGGLSAAPVLQEHTITADDLAKVVGEELPDDYAKLAQMDILGYERASEALAEEFHMDEDFLVQLNPGASFAEGETI